MSSDTKIGGPRVPPAAPAMESAAPQGAPAPVQPAAPPAAPGGWSAVTAKVSRAWTAGINEGRAVVQDVKQQISSAEDALKRKARDLEFKIVAAPIKTGGGD